MSNEAKSPTQTIREALAAMKSCIQCGEPWTDVMEREAMRPAMDSVRGIERAAKTLALHKPQESDEWDKSRDLMATIAKQAPEVRHVLTEGGIARLALESGIDLVTPKDE